MSRPVNRRAAAVAVFACLTVLKLGVWTVLESRGIVHAFAGDNATSLYIPISHRLLDEHRFNGPDTRPDSKVPPGYPLLIAASIAVRPQSFLALVPALQMLLDLGTALILYWLSVHMGLPWTGLLAGCAWLLYPPAVVLSTWITAETAFTTFFTLGLALLAVSFEKGGGKLALAGGLAMGVATMLRGTPLFLPVVLLPVAWRVGKLRHWLLFAAGMALFVAPWTIRNLAVLDDFIPVATGSGSVMLQGSDERFFTGDGKKAYYPAAFQEAIEAGIDKPATDRESKQDEWLGRVGVWVQRRRIAERPMSAIPFFAHKLVRLWYGTETGGFKSQALLGFCAFLVLPAGLWQLWRWRSSQPGVAYVALGSLAYLVLVHTATLPEARYTVPIFPVLMLGACRLYGRATAVFDKPRRPL
jgi:4-amino-4-deoxy-L-arabinose transferase-like glycosyltransferase